MAGELIIKNGLRVSGSITATVGLTGSFSGSISNATTASYALTASALLGSVTSASFAATSSFPWFPTGSNIAYVGGNVGIGTTNPTYKLQVQADGAGLYVLGASVSPFTQTIARFVYGGNGNTIDIENQGGKASIQARTLPSTASNLQLNPAGANVLVGTTTDGGFKFDVNGTGRFSGNLTITGSATNSLLVKGSGTTSATTAFRIENSSNTLSLAVLDNGFVGIRKSNPSAALEVSGSAIISGSIVQQGPGIYLYDSNGTGGGRINGSYGYLNGEVNIRPLGTIENAFTFSPNSGMSIGGFTIGGTAGSPPAYGLTVSGSVGIGTRVPTTQLDVSGSGRFTGNLTVTGSIIAASFTGSLFGTSSWSVSSSRAVSSSFASTASYWSGSITNATSASFASTASYVNTLNQDVIATGNIESQATLKSIYQAGDEGGEIFLNAPATNTTIPNGVTIDVYQNRLRIFEQGGSANGYYLDMPSGGPGVSTDLKPAGYTGTVNIIGNPPGQQFLNYVDGILISVT